MVKGAIRRGVDAVKLKHAAEQDTKRGEAASFTGTAWQQTLAVGEAPEPLHVARVAFEPGARTVWHTHPHGQILVATAGVGRLQLHGEPVLALLPGDSVTIAPGEKHWHGAAPDQLFTHLSIQAADERGGQATWLEQVTDEEYANEPN